MTSPTKRCEECETAPLQNLFPRQSRPGTGRWQTENATKAKMAVVKYNKQPAGESRKPTAALNGYPVVNLKLRIHTAFAAVCLLCLTASQTQAQEMAGGVLTKTGRSNLTTLDPVPPEGGWQGLANLLEAISPGTDTRLTPSASQITDHIERLLNQGAAQEALDRIEQREREIEGQRGTDVQLMFQHARALAALGRPDEAIAIYTEMTRLFPELPEPWNNLGVLYAANGDLERAQDALQMALRANPGYATARANLGDLQLMAALRSYQEAASQGASVSKTKVKDVESILKETKQ